MSSNKSKGTKEEVVALAKQMDDQFLHMDDRFLETNYFKQEVNL